MLKPSLLLSSVLTSTRSLKARSISSSVIVVVEQLLDVDRGTSPDTRDCNSARLVTAPAAKNADSSVVVAVEQLLDVDRGTSPDTRDVGENSGRNRVRPIPYQMIKVFEDNGSLVDIKLNTELVKIRNNTSMFTACLYKMM